MSLMNMLGITEKAFGVPDYAGEKTIWCPTREAAIEAAENQGRYSPKVTEAEFPKGTIDQMPEWDG